MIRKCFFVLLTFLVLLIGGEVIAGDLDDLLGSEEISGEYKLACGGYIENCKKQKWWVTAEAWYMNLNAMTSCKFSGEDWNVDMKLLYPEAKFDLSRTKIEIGIVPRKRSVEFCYSTSINIERLNFWRDLDSNFFKEDDSAPIFSFFVKEEQPL